MKKYKVGSTYRWPMSEDEHSGYDSKPSMWFTVTKELSEEEVEVIWCDGEVDSAFHSDFEMLDIPEVSAIGKYE